ncbi:MAG: hypothetical protein COA83_06275 [Methylophaga sp.]|nr:MAG: hypothetical protein COA83_06275 [Methylophaga sp.]
MKAILIVANKEFHDGLRNRWVMSISLIFALLATGLAYFGAAASGQAGFTNLSTTLVSLASLAVFVIPLIALMLSYDGVVGEDESGTLLLLMTYPLSRWQLILGKMMGHWMIIALSTIIGFGLSAIIMGLFSEDTSWGELVKPYAFFIAFAILLGWIFIAIATMISASVVEKSKAAGLALIVWFMFVFMFDLFLLGLLVGTEGNVNAELFPYLLLLNPTDIFRLIIIDFFAQQELTGLMAVAQHAQFATSSLILSMLAWFIAPVLLAILLFNRRKL